MRVVTRGSSPAVLTVMLALNTAVVGAARLHPEAIAAWSTYVSVTESRIQGELESSRGFLAIDFLQDAASQRRDVLAGGVVIEKAQNVDAQGRKLIVPSALVHHLRGDVLIPGVTVQQLLAELQTQVPRQEDVLRSTILERGPDRMRVYLRLQRKRFVTVVYNSEHTVAFTRFGNTRATSTSIATRIAEVSDPDTAQEHELPMGEDRGFLWRLNAYWRYEEVAGGVVAECESLSLSRDVPSVVRYLVNPLVESTARESMERTLLTLRMRFAKT